MNFKVEGNELTIFLENRIDAQNSFDIEREIFSIVAANPAGRVTFDAGSRNTFRVPACEF